MPGDTSILTTNQRDGSHNVVKVEGVSGQETINELEEKLENVIRTLGIAVIKNEFENPDIREKEILKGKIAAEFDYTIPEGAKWTEEDLLESFNNVLENSDVIDKLVSAMSVIELGFSILNAFSESFSKIKEFGADPVMMFNGQFTHTTRDIHINGAGMDFDFVRIYKNQAAYKGPLGHNWDHNYNLWLRVSEDNQTVIRSTGAVREEKYKKHPVFDYWVPPDGDDGAIIQESDFFVYKTRDGTKYLYKQHSTELSFVMVIDRVEDRFGNFLEFTYKERLLHLVHINHMKRTVEFSYDDSGKISTIKDYTGRIWRYIYDDFDDLIVVKTPGMDRYPQGLSTCYDYSSAQYTGELQHNLTKIMDANGQLYLENEYGTDPGILNFNRVIRQRQGGGETLFEFEDVIEDFDFDYHVTERPAHQTTMTARNGHKTNHIYNRFGNLLVKEECVILGGIPKVLRSHYRYNRDGNLIASLSPEGVITQYLFGRELFIRQHQIENEDEIIAHDSLTIENRQSFSHLLAVVRRNKYFNIVDLNLSRGVWGDIFPDIFSTDPRPDGNPEDIIVKNSYEPVYGQILTQSDPRYTNSADPNSTNEHPRYEETLTRYSYTGPVGDPNLFLAEIKKPTTTLPDGTTGSEIIERYEEYDQRGRLIRYVNPVGTALEYSYIPEDNDDLREGHLQKSILDPGGLAITRNYEIDNLGRVLATHLPKAEEAADGRFIIESKYNELDQMIEAKTSKPFEFKIRRFYDRNGTVERVERDARDEEGNEVNDAPLVQTFEYDEEIKLTKESIGGKDLSSHLATRYCYDISGKRILTVQPKGNQTRTKYDERLLQVAVTEGSGTGDSSTTHMKYDADGRLIGIKDGRGHITDYTLDSFGRVIYEEDTLGNITVNTYDKANNLLVVRIFERQDDGTYFLLSRSEVDYDELNRPIREGVNRFDEPIGPFEKIDLKDAFVASPGPGKLLITQTFYDAQSRIVSVLDSLGRETIGEYDALDRLVSATDPLGNRAENHYDSHDNLIRIDQIDLVLDPESGALLGKRCFSTIYAYDELDRMISKEDSLGNTFNYLYDSRNNLVRTVDPLGNVSRLEFDIYGRTVSEIIEQTETGLGEGPQLSPAINKYLYDENSNVVEVIDALERRTRYEFDALDRTRKIIYPDNSEQLFDYDENSNLIRKQDNNGLQHHIKLDKLDRIVRVEVDDAELAPDVKVEGSTFEEYVYDGLGRQVSGKNEFTEFNIGFNSLGWPVNEFVSFMTPEIPFDNPLHVAREFDDAGNVIGFTYPNGRRVKFHRDMLDRLIRIENISRGQDYPGAQDTPDVHDIVEIVYIGRERGRLVSGNGTKTEYSHDGAARMIEVSHETPSGPLLTIQYLYDAVGNVRLRNDIGQADTLGERFDYDSFYRLANIRQSNISSFDPNLLAPMSEIDPDETHSMQSDIDNLIGQLSLPTGKQTFDYDLVGNRKREKLSDDSELDYTVNNLDQYVSIEGSDFTYDRNGNLKSDGKREYVYDSMNRLVRVIDTNTKEDVSLFFHDSIGRRILEIKNGEAAHLVYDGNNLISEYKAGRPFAQYVQDDGIDRNIQITTNGSEHWYHTDLTNSVRIVTDNEGNEAASYQYNPFGQMTLLSANDIYNPVRYNSRRFDDELNTYDYRTRQYDPRSGRFLQRDSTGMTDGTNMYTYVTNNPLSFTDPFGTERTEREDGLTFAQIMIGFGGTPVSPTAISRDGLFRLEEVYAVKNYIEHIDEDYLPAPSGDMFSDPTGFEPYVMDDFLLGMMASGDTRFTNVIRHIRELKERRFMKKNTLSPEKVFFGRIFMDSFLPTGTAVDFLMLYPTAYSFSRIKLPRFPRIRSAGKRVFSTTTKGIKRAFSKAAKGIRGIFPKKVKLDTPITHGPITLTGKEVELYNSVMTSEHVVIGRLRNNLLFSQNPSVFSLDAWLSNNRITWTPRIKQVYEVSLYSRTASGKPVHALPGWKYTAAEVEAAELGARKSGIFNIPSTPPGTSNVPLSSP